jgi:hypothetical protein
MFLRGEVRARAAGRVLRQARVHRRAGKREFVPERRNGGDGVQTASTRRAGCVTRRSFSSALDSVRRLRSRASARSSSDDYVL